MSRLPRSPSIKEFPREDERVWQIEWLDGLELNPSQSAEPCIRVVLRPAIDGHVGTGKELQRRESRVVLIGVGQLPILRPGSLWAKGRLQDAPGRLVVPLKGIDVSSKTVSPDGGDARAFQRLIDRRFYGFWKEERPRLLVLTLKTPILVKENSYSEVLFPTFEIIRFYYARSTRLAHAVFGGLLRNGFDKVLNDAVTSRNEETGEVYVKLRTGFARPDGWTLARMRFEKEAEAGGRMVADSIVKDAANNRIPQPAGSFPFVGRTDLSVSVKRVQGGDGEWRLLVLSINSCSAAFPFRELVVDLDNDARPGEQCPTGDEELVGWPIQYPAIIGPDGEAELNSEGRADAQIEAVRLEGPSGEFLALAGKRIHVPRKDRIHYTRGRWTFLNNPDIDGLSTSAGGGSGLHSGLGLFEDGNSETDEDSDDGGALPGGIGNLRGLLEAFNNVENCVADARSPTLSTECLPLTSSKGRPQWAYLDSAKHWGRGVFVVDLSVDGVGVSLVEFQRRKGERACLGVVAGGDGGIVSDSQLATVLSILSQAKGNWDLVSSRLTGILQIAGFKHTWSSYAIGAERVLKLLRKEQFLPELDLRRE